MTDETPKEMLQESLDIAINLNPFFVTKTEIDIPIDAARIARRLVKTEEDPSIEILINPSCVACNTSTDGATYNIYTSLTENSRCLLSEFITKTSQIIFDRDKVWSEVLCKECFDLLTQLDEAETEFLNLKNEFLVILKNNERVSGLASLKKALIACQTQTDPFPGKIEFCDVTVKDEFEDNVSMPPSPMNVSDSDDEPLCRNKLPEVKKEKRIKIETTTLVIETLPEEYSCRDCAEKFNSKSLAAVHAFTVHRIDCAKDPGVIIITADVKPHKKRRGKKKSKRKSYAESDNSNVEDEEWANSKPAKVKPKKSERAGGRTLVKPLKISLELPKPFKTASQLQRKLQSSNLVIKKLPYAPHLKQTKASQSKSSAQSKKDKLTIMGHTNPSAVLSTLQSAGLQVCSNVETVIVDAIKQPKDMLPCLECSATFNTQARLDCHTVKAHMASKSPFICEICGASYKHKKACDIHVGMHKGISPWKCGVCAKIFPSKGALSRHEAIHTGKPNYQCDLCGKSFIHTSSFKMHKLSHTGVKPHSCNKCGLALMTRSHLKRHQRVHSGEKRHECLICGKKFSERYNLYAHHKSHESVAIQRQAKNHDCTMCEATFNRRYILEKHMETVHQRIMDTGPKRPRNTMTKLLKRQLLLGARLAAHDGQDVSATETEDLALISATSCEITEVKTSPTSPQPAIVHTNTDSTSSTLIGESSFQQTSGAQSPLPHKVEDSPEEGQSTGQENQSQAVISGLPWQALNYHLANDYPLRMHGVDYAGYLNKQ